MNMDKEQLRRVGIIGGLVLAALVVLFVVVGPRGCTRIVTSWSASAYGSDWLVVLYSQNGSVIASWELHDKSIGNEPDSDGVFFTDDGGNVVHLSGHYVWVQVKEGNWDAVRKTYVEGRQRVGP